MDIPGKLREHHSSIVFLRLAARRRRQRSGPALAFERTSAKLALIKKPQVERFRGLRRYKRAVLAARPTARRSNSAHALRFCAEAPPRSRSESCTAAGSEKVRRSRLTFRDIYSANDRDRPTNRDRPSRGR